VLCMACQSLGVRAGLDRTANLPRVTHVYTSLTSDTLAATSGRSWAWTAARAGSGSRQASQPGRLTRNLCVCVACVVPRQQRGLGCTHTHTHARNAQRGLRAWVHAYTRAPNRARKQATCTHRAATTGDRQPSSAATAAAPLTMFASSASTAAARRQLMRANVAAACWGACAASSRTSSCSCVNGPPPAAAAGVAWAAAVPCDASDARLGL
jgi:hypothetical protein